MNSLGGFFQSAIGHLQKTIKVSGLSVRYTSSERNTSICAASARRPSATFANCCILTRAREKGDLLAAGIDPGDQLIDGVGHVLDVFDVARRCPSSPRRGPAVRSRTSFWSTATSSVRHASLMSGAAAAMRDPSFEDGHVERRRRPYRRRRQSCPGRAGFSIWASIFCLACFFAAASDANLNSSIAEAPVQTGEEFRGLEVLRCRRRAVGRQDHEALLPRVGEGHHLVPGGGVARFRACTSGRWCSGGGRRR